MLPPFLTKIKNLSPFILLGTALCYPSVLYAQSKTSATTVSSNAKALDATRQASDDTTFQADDFIPAPPQTLYTLKLVGIKNSDARKNAEIYVSMIPTEEMDGSLRNFYLVRTAIQKAISVYGYFNSTIKFDVVAPEEGEKKGTLIVTVNQGPATDIAGINVNVTGQAHDDEAFEKLLTQVPAIGTQLNQQTYDNFKEDLRQLGIERGYFDADFTSSQLDVKPSTQQAWWNLDYDSGTRYKFGRFTFENSQIRQDYLRHIMHMKDGDPYNMEDLAALNSDLSSSGWFKVILFQPKINKEDKTVNVNVLLYPQKKNVFKVGIGYSTDVGARFQLGWNKPWVDSKGQSLRSNFYISKPKLAIEAAYRMPLLKNPLNYYYEAAYGIEREKQNDTTTNATSASFMRYWNRETGWQNGLGVRVRYDSFTQANQSHKTLLIYPTVSATRTRFRGGLFPYWGDTQRISIGVGSKAWGSQVNFYKIEASTIWIRTYFKKHRFISRAGAGYLKTSDFDRIPPALRFFLGGDRTLRGYKYKTVAPRDSEGKLVGGSIMGYAGLEYDYQLFPKWWTAVFADTGFVSDKFKHSDLRYGTGFGLRWISPVGPVKFDIATPVHSDHHNVQFYLSLGTEL